MVAVNDDAAQNIEDRDAEIFYLRRIERWTERKLAERFGLSQQRISQICAVAQAKLPPIDLGAIQRQALEVHEDVIRRAYEVANLRGAPITAGKDGDIVLDPEDQSVVRDYSALLAALKVVNQSVAEIRKLQGLDAAQRIDTTATVKYIIEGVDPEDLK